MKQEPVLKIMKALGCKSSIAFQRAGWIVSSCPLGAWEHENGKSNPQAFGVKKEPGDPFCNCFSCGFHGPMSEMLFRVKYKNVKLHHRDYDWPAIDALHYEGVADSLSELGQHETLEDLFNAPRQELHQFPEWWLESFSPWDAYEWSKDYTLERGITPAVAKFMDLRADNFQKRVCFPVRDFSGKLRGLHGRSALKEPKLRYRMYTHEATNNPICWLGEHWVDYDRPMILVEGPMDVASVMRVYRNVTSPLFVNFSQEKMHRMSDVFHWITLFDNGKGGDAGRAKLDKMMPSTNVLQHLLPPVGTKDPGAMNLEEISELISQVVELDTELT